MYQLYMGVRLCVCVCDSDSLLCVLLPFGNGSKMLRMCAKVVERRPSSCFVARCSCQVPAVSCVLRPSAPHAHHLTAGLHSRHLETSPSRQPLAAIRQLPSTYLAIQASSHPPCPAQSTGQSRCV